MNVSNSHNIQFTCLLNESGQTVQRSGTVILLCYISIQLPGVCNYTLQVMIKLQYKMQIFQQS